MSEKSRYALKAKVWLWPGEQAAWHFISVPKKESTRIKKAFGANARGWGPLPVRVTIKKTSWTTSIFPDKKSGTYVLPLKAEVRKKESLQEGDVAYCELTICV